MSKALAGATTSTLFLSLPRSLIECFEAKSWKSTSQLKSVLIIEARHFVANRPRYCIVFLYPTCGTVAASAMMLKENKCEWNKLAHNLLLLRNHWNVNFDTSKDFLPLNEKKRKKEKTERHAMNIFCNCCLATQRAEAFFGWCLQTVAVDNNGKKMRRKKSFIKRKWNDFSHSGFVFFLSRFSRFSPSTTTTNANTTEEKVLTINSTQWKFLSPSNNLHYEYHVIVASHFNLHLKWKLLFILYSRLGNWKFIATAFENAFKSDKLLMDELF